MKSKKRVDFTFLKETDSYYNFLVNQKLDNSHGVSVATFPYDLENLDQEGELEIADSGINGVDGVAYFKQYHADIDSATHRILLYAGDQKVYINQMLDGDFSLNWMYRLEFSTPPITLSYKKDGLDCIILASKNEMKIWKTGYSPYDVEGVPIITSMCMNEGVLFCTIQEPAFKIWYATDLDAENVGNISSYSGYITLADDLGNARKILVFDGDVYIFRDYGISKLNYVSKDISVSQMYISNTKIYSDTVNVCGNEILFMTKDGLYSFNGLKVKRLDINISDLLPNSNDNAVASSLGSKYYIALRLDFDDDKVVSCEDGDYINNAVLIVDMIDYSFEIIRGVDIKALLPIKTEYFEKMLVTFHTQHNDKLGQIVGRSICFDKALPKCWKSKDLEDNFNVKLFTKLSVDADKGVTFKIIYDDKTLSFTTYTTGLNEFIFKIMGKQIRLEISSTNESAIVKKVLMDYYEY